MKPRPWGRSIECFVALSGSLFCVAKQGHSLVDMSHQVRGPAKILLNVKILGTQNKVYFSKQTKSEFTQKFQ